MSRTVIPPSEGAPSPKYFEAPSDPFWLKWHQFLHPLVVNNDHLITNIQAFFGVRHRGNMFEGFPFGMAAANTTVNSKSLSTKDSIVRDNSLDSHHHHGHVIFSPIRGPAPIHLMMCAGAELGNELFYGVWVILTNMVWDVQTSIPLLLLWAVGLGLAQLMKDKLQLPRPGLQYWNPVSSQFKKEVPADKYIHRLETCYSAEYGFPSAHCIGSCLALLNLWLLWTNYAHFEADSTGVASLSVVTRFVVTIACLFWFFMTPISRLYCGVHSVLDIVGGLVVGLFCMTIVILSSALLSTWVLTTLSGLLCLILFSVAFTWFYPKHEHLWTNSSGDTALVWGTMTGSVIFAASLPHLAHLFPSTSPTSILTDTTPAEITGSFLKQSMAKVAIKYQHILPPFSTPIPSLPSLSLGQTLTNTDGVLTSVLLGCVVVFGRGVVSLVSGYIVKDVVFRPIIFRSSRFLLGFVSKPRPYTESESIGADSSGKMASGKDEMKDNGNNNINNTTPPDLEHVNLPSAQAARPTLNSASNSSAHTITLGSGSAHTESPSSGMSFRGQEQKPEDKQTITGHKSSEQKEHPSSKPTQSHPVPWHGPPKTSSLFKWTHDMPLQKANIVDMADKWVGYVSMTLVALYLNAFCDEVLINYWLYFPGAVL